jgi:hypothetical protein
MAAYLAVVSLLRQHFHVLAARMGRIGEEALVFLRARYVLCAKGNASNNVELQDKLRRL